MILVDTSIWIDHFRAGDARLAAVLEANTVLSHPAVIGEIALGNLPRREMVLTALRNLPQAAIATEAELARFIEDETLHGLGIGYVDAHLLAATRLTPEATLWTRDARLAAAAARLGVAEE